MTEFDSQVFASGQPRLPARTRFVTREVRMEHRWGVRRPCRIPVRICAGGIEGHGRLRDVSMSGTFLETALKLPMFAQVAIEVVCHADMHCEECTGTVVRREHDGVGIEWSEPVAGSICIRLGCGSSCPYAEGSG